MKRLSLRGHAKTLYFKFIDVLHFPFVRRGVEDPYHKVFQEFLALGREIPSPAVLEIGSRKVTSVTRRDLFPHCKEYVGFDLLPGDGVDVVGDVHRLSECCPLQHFDIVYSVSVFEHLLFPWKAVLEINKVMKPGGYLHVSTHPVWPAHELPSDFWRFPCNGFYGLFNKFTGFEVVALTEGLPCKAYSLVDDAPTRILWFWTLHQGVSLIARKTGDYRADLLKWDIDIAEILNMRYPGKTAT